MNPFSRNAREAAQNDKKASAVASMADDDEIFLNRPMPCVLRLVIGAMGLFAIVAPAWEFRHAFVSLNWFSLFFGFILLGAWSVGATFLLASILGEDQRWRFRDGEIEILRRSAIRRWTTVVRASDVSATEIEETIWDSGPNTFSVVLRLHNGDAFETQGFEERQNAVALESRIRAKLQLD